MSNTARPFVIAIVGAGIGGLAAAISLRRLPNVEVHVFEQAEELREVGASIALGPNGLRSLEAIGAVNALSDDVGFRSDHGIPHIFQHWKSGEILVKDLHTATVTQRNHHTTRFYRPHLLDALAENLPQDILHFHKRLLNVEVRPEGASLDFEDGERFEADLVVGADGIKSTVRKSYLPEFQLQFTGQVWLRGVFPISRLDDLGIENINNSVHYVGPDRSFFSSALGKDLFTVVGSRYEDPATTPWTGKEWNDVGEVQHFRDYFKGWHPTIQAIVERTPDIHVFPGWSSEVAPPPTSQGRIVLIGDSFHPHGGAFAAGGSLAIDDGRALYLALSHTEATSSNEAQRPDRLSRALDLYKAIRLPHIDKVMLAVKASRANAAKPGQPWSEEKIREWARTKNGQAWIHEHDVIGAFKETLVANRSEEPISVRL